MRTVRARIAALAAALLALSLAPAAATAADQLYWGNLFDNRIAFTDLDGGHPGSLNVSAPIVAGPFSVALDAAADKVYWGNGDAGAIWAVNLDGSGLLDLPIGAATLAFPFAIAVDPVAGKIYWGSGIVESAISVANLDGSGAQDLPIAGATVSNVRGVAIDDVHGRIYWVSGAPELGAISSAELDGSDARNLTITGDASVVGPSGIAVDPVAGKIYWANGGFAVDGEVLLSSISVANLDGSESADIALLRQTSPVGVAVDPVAGKIYWSAGAQLESANLDGSDLHAIDNTLGAGAPAILRAPQPLAAPAVSGGSQSPTTLTCSTGTWARDIPGLRYARAPHAFRYQWMRDGQDIGGATGATLTTSDGGSYACRESAENHAGAASQTSAAHQVAPAPSAPRTGADAPPAFAASPGVTLATGAPARGRTVIKLANTNAFAVKATVTARTAKPLPGAHGRRVALRAVRLTLAAGKTGTLKLALPRAIKRALAAKHTVKLAFTITLTDPAGHHRTLKRTTVLRPARTR
jgi:DNA-binding beta-propeller fold protein YncE